MTRELARRDHGLAGSSLYDRTHDFPDLCERHAARTHYSVVVTNTSGSVTSAVATLFVHGDSAARLKSMEYAANQFRMHIYGLTNRAYAVQSSTNLVNWQTVFTNYVSFWYTNLSASNEPMRFYRAVTNN